MKVSQKNSKLTFVILIGMRMILCVQENTLKFFSIILGYSGDEDDWVDEHNRSVMAFDCTKNGGKK